MAVLDARLISKYVESPSESSSLALADVRLKEYGCHVWALVAYRQAVAGDLNRVAEDYEIPREAVDAAMAYYDEHRALIDKRLALGV